MDHIIFKMKKKKSVVGKGETVQIRIPTPMYAKIKDVSIRTGISTKDVANRLLEFAFEHTILEEG